PFEHIVAPVSYWQEKADCGTSASGCVSASADYKRILKNCMSVLNQTNTQWRPKLGGAVHIGRLDVARDADSYLVAADDGRQWQVAPCMARFLALLDGSRSLQEVQRELTAADFAELSGCSAEEILDRFVIP